MLDKTIIKLYTIIIVKQVIKEVFIMAYRSMRDRMFESAVHDMTKNLKKDVSEMSKMSRMQPKMYARTKEDPFPKNCYLCGTHDNVQTIEYGINTANIIQNILVCPTCRKWLGEFLLSDETQKVADISN